MSFKGHRPRKSFGQHWLKNESVLDKIVEAANIDSEDRILEIGPGKGALTQRLLRSKASLIQAVEVDRDLVLGLRKKFSNFSNFSLVEGDALALSQDLIEGSSLNKVVANIPYNITAPLLEKLIGKLATKSNYSFTLLVLLMQKEVADRIISQPGNSSYSALSIRTQLIAKCSEVCTVSPESFYPIPKVYSKVLLLKPFLSKHRLPISIERKLDNILRVAFLSRRKKIRNTLSNITDLDLLENITSSVGIRLDQRPQEISITQWVALARAMK